MKKPYLIAEIGVNFYDTAKFMNITPIEAAKLYVKKAKDAGIDCAKFQAYKAKTIASKNSPSYWDLTKEPTTSQYELFTKFDSFNEEDYKELSKYSNSIGIDFIATPFDYQSADFLFDLVNFYKISSSDLSNIPFIKYIGKKGKPVCISVGAAYMDEAKEALEALKEVGCKDITIMHCVLSYPTKPQDANLNIIKTLKNEFKDYKIGYSDHVAPDECMQTVSTAYLLGAEVIEKHFTLDKTLVGNDHYHAGDPNDFEKIIVNLKWIDTILGSGEKTVLDCEKESRKQARRSLVLTHDMKKGDTITDKDIVAKRPGTGISPKDTEKVIGKKINVDLKEDDILEWGMLF